MKIEQHPDLDKRQCADCDKTVYVITTEPPDDPNAFMLTDGVWVEKEDCKPFVLCDDCAEGYYNKGKLGFGGSGDAFMV